MRSYSFFFVSLNLLSVNKVFAPRFPGYKTILRDLAMLAKTKAPSTVKSSPHDKSKGGCVGVPPSTRSSSSNKKRARDQDDGVGSFSKRPCVTPGRVREDISKEDLENLRKACSELCDLVFKDLYRDCEAECLYYG